MRKSKIFNCSKKLIPSYIGTSIENKPAWMKRGEKLHRDMHKKLTNIKRIL